jgi:hypothetical protein
MIIFKYATTHSNKRRLFDNSTRIGYPENIALDINTLAYLGAVSTFNYRQKVTFKAVLEKIKGETIRF